MFQLADELVQKWGNTPPEEHIALHETGYDMAASVMLQCSLDKHFHNVAKEIRRNYDVVGLNESCGFNEKHLSKFH